jgi:hypothetical protein
MVVDFAGYADMKQELRDIEQEIKAIEAARCEQLEQFLTQMLAELEAA